ncbi:DUF3795 domain-containing protein [Eubacteriales bacterium OttesenSCG-928-A19]|nr:DUF3795 domain-containing protein [Eubacteriales bacterium OttesenSCG-928-A19]
MVSGEKYDPGMLAYCGIYCDLCSFRVAHNEQDRGHLDNIPARYERKDLSEYDCDGCKGANCICGGCDMKGCAQARGIDSCADCDSFPCEIIERFGTDGTPHHHDALKNLHAIREKGTEAWFAAMRPALRCACGNRQSWYHTCPEHS